MEGVFDGEAGTGVVTCKEAGGWCSREEGGAEGRSEDSRDDGANSITVTSRLVFGEGERDLGHGGRGEPPVEDPSGDGRSIEGDGEGEGVSDRGDGGGKELVDLGVVGRDAPGEIEVGLGRRFFGGVKARSGAVCECGKGGGEGDV